MVAQERLLKLPLHTVDILSTGGIAALTVQLARRLAPPAQRSQASLLALLLLCTSPFFLVLSGSMMNHTWTAFLLLVVLLLIRAGVGCLSCKHPPANKAKYANYGNNYYNLDYAKAFVA